MINRSGKLLLVLVVGAALFVSTAGPSAAAAPDLKVEGSSIIDGSTGSEFVPRGVNWPSFEYACIQGWGYSNFGATRATAAAMKEWNINTVRIPVNQDCWLGDDGQPTIGSTLFTPTAAGYRGAIEAFVGFLNDQDIAVVLDLHWTGQAGTVADGLRPMADERSVDFWKSAALAFRDNGSVMFDLFNEPHSRWDSDRNQWAFRLTWQCWVNGGCIAPDQPDTVSDPAGLFYTAAGMTDLVTAVRSVGAEQPLILGGLDYANDLSDWKANAPEDDQLIAGFHNYPGKRCDELECWDHEIATVAKEVPVLTGEVGQKDCASDFTTGYLDWADRHGIGYLAWAWWDLSGTILEPGPGCSNFALIQDLDGSPTVPYGSDFKAHLAAPLDEVVPPPLPPKRRPAGVKIISAKMKGGKIRATFRLHPLATGKITSRLTVRKGQRRKTLRAKGRLNAGRSRVTMTIRRGWKAKKLVVFYPGNELIKPDKSSRRFLTVSKRIESRR
ncbi:MAG: cellulase family glycosylhydrolase [Solirubrobacterales bacterium]